MPSKYNADTLAFICRINFYNTNKKPIDIVGIKIYYEVT